MGKVFLVGAGPGDPELLTLKALRLLQRADVVLHDGLVTREIIELIRPEARVIDIGKRCGQKLLTQDEINSLLIDFAREMECVVRLKGGDPSVFGRAGEEIEALTAAEVAYEIVPGITSALAAAAAAGLSLTDRRFASSVVLATAHRGTGQDAVEWDRLVNSGSTLAIYMPGTDYAQLSASLTTAGLDRQTPCAVVSCIGRKGEQVLWATVASLARCAALPAPAHVIVGRCANPPERYEAAIETMRVQVEIPTTKGLRLT
jgi:uroporphyrin-III C-methyltransferase